MFCSKCGQELNLNSVCTNPSCPSNATNNSETNTNYSNTNQYQPQEINSYGYDEYSSTSSTDEYADMYGVTPNEMMDFIGDKKTEFYMEKWTRYQENDKFISWNWPAFFFGLIWFAYRKMYGIAGIIFGISILSSIFTSVIFDLSGLNSLISLAVMIGSGLLANQLYIKNCIKKITGIKNAIPNMSKEDLSRRLRANGGINWIPVIVIVVIYAILLILIFIIVAALIGGASNLIY
ncbi:DUF2628 domain-containing protein [Clostridium paraputrificum]|uniref:DUF2628 domain-containing protein n=1 Tax=Clostridium TaxID=1485 RepID=UPI003D3295DC